ncbi:MAG TPA: hypothetical protein VGG54_22955 [Trebonia sp.]|jgi:hypothetical protein
MAIPKGYGRADARLADGLERAATAADADRIAKADGHADRDAAEKWLEERSG